MTDMGDGQRELIVMAISAIGQGQSTIMHALTALAMNGGDEMFPGLRDDIDKFSEWLQVHHHMVAQSEDNIPHMVVVVPPIHPDVM